MRVACATLGCKLNQFESEAMLTGLGGAGHRVVPFVEEADLYLINTCTVTAEADADSRQLVRQAVRRNPRALVVVTGCYAQMAATEVAEIPGVDLILGSAEKAELLRHLAGLGKANGAGPIVRVGEILKHRTFDDLGPSVDADRTRAFLKVQDGCNYRCAFCIVPFARGGNRSQTPDRVLADIARLAEAGFPEVVLTGIHLGAYGRDLPTPVPVAELCRRIAVQAPPIRVRLSSLDPHEVRDDLIALLRDSRTFCRHLHLPLQSGDDLVLRRMRRGYTAHTFEALVRRLVAEIAGIAITGDVIVGFPGEDEAAFANTYSLLEALPIAGMHVFAYSRRPGTDAAAYLDQVPRAVKAERSRALRHLVARKSREFRAEFIGETLEVVVLDRRDREAGLLEGLTDNYIRAFFKGDDALRGRRALVRIEEVTVRGTWATLHNA